MSRVPLRLIPCCLAIALLVVPPAARAADSVSAEAAARMERVLQIKRLQHELLMREGFEAWEGGGESAECEDALREFEARRATEEPALGSRGQSQRPAPASIDERIPGTSRLTKRLLSTLSYARNVQVSDPSLDNPSRQDTQSEPSIVAFGNHVIAAWNDGRGSAVSGIPPPTLSNLMHYAYSTDGGATFTSSPTPLPVQMLGGVWTSDPVLAVDERTGEFYFAGLFDPPTGGADEHGVAVMRATFNGASPPSWTFPVVVASDPAGPFDRVQVDKPWIAVDPDSGTVYLTYTHFTDTSDSIVFARSRDKGATWGPRIVINSTGFGHVQGSRPVPGLNGQVFVAWKEIGQTATGEDYLRIRRSSDRGASWTDPQRQVCQLFDNFGTGAPGFNREQGITLPSIAIDRSSGPHRGRIYVAWNECANFFDSIPDSARASEIFENEPPTAMIDDTPQDAIAFTPGQGIIGSFTTLQDAGGLYTDLDYYKFSAEQGSSYVFWANELPTRYTMRVFSSDGVTRLAFAGDRSGSPPASGFIMWTCPRTGTYYLRMAIFGSTPGYYRVDTGIDAPGGPNQRARDQRDAFVSYSDDGTSWSTPSMVSADEPGTFDDWLPEVAVAGNGTVYAMWYDFSDTPAAATGGYSQTHMARSDDGGSSWASLGPVSEAFTNWSNTNSNIIPNQGDYLALYANATGVYPCWSDGRFGNPGTPDVWAAPFGVNAVQAVIEAVATDTNLVSITWHLIGAPIPATAVLMRALGGGAYQSLGTISVGIDDRIQMSDPTVSIATQYRYAVQVAGQLMGERTVVTPGRDRPTFELLGAVPNPSSKALRVRFSLPDAQPAELALFDVTGRPLRKETYYGVGPHDLSFGTGLDLKPGGYYLRLTQAGRETTKALTIIP